MTSVEQWAGNIAGANTMGQIVAKSTAAIGEACDVEAIVILREKGGELKCEAESGWEPLDGNAWASASLCLAEGKATGRFTESFPTSEWHFVALEGPHCRLGVVGTRAAHDRRWDEANEDSLRTLATTASIAVAREMA